METKTLSVCVAIFNVEQFLPEALLSLKRSKKNDIEFLLVNDGSSDHSGDICKKFVDEDSRFKLINHSKNMSLIQTRKTALGFANGKYILFLDGDDYLDSENLDKLSQFLSQKTEDIIGFKTNCFGKNTAEVSDYQTYFSRTFPAETSSLETLPQLIFQERTLPWNVINKVYRKTLMDKVFQHVNDIYLTSGEDAFVTFLSLIYARSCTNFPFYVYNYRVGAGISGGQETIEKFRYHYKDINLTQYLSVILQSTRPEDMKLKRALSALGSHLRINTIKRYYKLKKSSQKEGLILLSQAGYSKNIIFWLTLKILISKFLHIFFPRKLWRNTKAYRAAKRLLYK